MNRFRFTMDDKTKELEQIDDVENEQNFDEESKYSNPFADESREFKSAPRNKDATKQGSE